MSRKWTIPAIFAGLMIATTGAAGAQERYEDAVGDAKGVAPDIVAVTLSEPEGSLVSIDVEFASAPPLGTDGETWTDVLFVGLTAEPDNDLLGDSEHTMYMFGAHATRLPLLVSEGGTLFGPQDMYWRVIDVAVDGSTVSFTLDRKLIGDPFDSTGGCSSASSPKMRSRPTMHPRQTTTPAPTWTSRPVTTSCGARARARAVRA